MKKIFVLIIVVFLFMGLINAQIDNYIPKDRREDITNVRVWDDSSTICIELDTAESSNCNKIYVWCDYCGVSLNLEQIQCPSNTFKVCEDIDGLCNSESNNNPIEITCYATLWELYLFTDKAGPYQYTLGSGTQTNPATYSDPQEYCHYDSSEDKCVGSCPYGKICNKIAKDVCECVSEPSVSEFDSPLPVLVMLILTPIFAYLILRIRK